MRATASLILVSLAVALAADDPGGWTTAKWGMTDAEIFAAVPGADRLDPPDKYSGARVHIPSLDIESQPFHIYFVPDKDGRLAVVNLSPIGKPAEGYDYLFERFSSLLVEKYGRPWHSKEGSIEEYQWSLKTTTVTLSRAKFPGLADQVISIQYKKKTGAAL